MKRLPGRKLPVNLSDSFRQHLNRYSLAASAAGVGALALAQPAEAKIVHTKTHQLIGWSGTYGLDLNNDGTIDFLIQESGSAGSLSFNLLYTKEALGNAVEGKGKLFASALQRGAWIGPGKHFLRGGYPGEAMVSINHGFGGSGTQGPWVNAVNRYLGLKFQINGKTHYGWARLSVQVQSPLGIAATLTSYAYETIPNKPIRAGQTVGEADTATTNPDWVSSGASDPHAAVAEPRSDIARTLSLGALALGAQGAPLRRRP
jgi:hypothetical protein